MLLKRKMSITALFTCIEISHFRKLEKKLITQRSLYKAKDSGVFHLSVVKSKPK